MSNTLKAAANALVQPTGMKPRAADQARRRLNIERPNPVRRSEMLSCVS